MAKESQFAGLEMKELVGAPLFAVAKESVEQAQSTAEFISQVRLQEHQKVRNAQFDSIKKTEDFKDD